MRGSPLFVLNVHLKEDDVRGEARGETRGLSLPGRTSVEDVDAVVAAFFDRVPVGAPAVVIGAMDSAGGRGHGVAVGTGASNELSVR